MARRWSIICVVTAVLAGCVATAMAGTAEQRDIEALKKALERQEESIRAPEFGEQLPFRAGEAPAQRHA